VKEKSDDNNDNKGFTAIANTYVVDRDREVVLPKGCVYDLYLKNPVMLNIHDYNSPSVGKVTDIRVGDQIQFDFEFAQTPEGKQFEYLYSNGFQEAFSIGFVVPHTGAWIETGITGKDICCYFGGYC